MVTNPVILYNLFNAVYTHGVQLTETVHYINRKRGCNLTILILVSLPGQVPIDEPTYDSNLRNLNFVYSPIIRVTELPTSG